MKKLLPLFIVVFSVFPVLAQKTTTKNHIIFAVINDGKALEPVAKIENGKLLQTVSGGDDSAILTAFSKTYYKPKTAYNLIFGGSVAGTVSVVKNNPTAECSTNIAEVITKSTRAKLKGFVMGLATDLKPAGNGTGLRRIPTAAERKAVEKLVSAEFAKNKVSAKVLKSHNLTVLDIDRDGKFEFVGTYWVATAKKERALLFFIADSSNGNKLGIGFSDFRIVKQDEVMSGEISALDDGIYHEMLLDVLDFNGDGIGEIFSYSQGFEGSSFNAYQRNAGKWESILEASNYHCGY